MAVIMAILDQYGNPIQPKTLDEPQTARLLHLQKSTIGHPTRGITPAKLNQILEDAEKGNLVAQHELFEDMEERDAHLFSELSKRKRAVTKLGWDVVPPRNATPAEEQLAEYAKELLLDMTDFEDMMFDALNAIGHGFAAIEYTWQRIGSDWTIGKFEHRPQSWFKMDEARTGLLLRGDSGGEGVPLQPFSWMLHTHRAKSGYLARSGLYRVLVGPYLYKFFSAGDLAELLDIYGIPLRIGKYPSTATNAEKMTLWQAVAGIGHNAAAVIPQSMQIEFQQAVAGSEKPFEYMIGWCERSQSKAILGSTLTSDAGATGLGSGLAEIHNEVRLDIRDSDCKQLAGTITRDLIYPLLAINKGVQDVRRCPHFVFDTQEAEDLQMYADSLPKLAAINMQIPASWAHDKLRIPQAQDNEPVLQIPSAKPAESAKNDTNSPSALRAALKAEASGADEFADQQAVDDALDGIAEDIRLLATQWLEPAVVALKQADSPEQAFNILTAAHPKIRTEVLAEALARAMFVCDLMGADSAAKDLL